MTKSAFRFRSFQVMSSDRPAWRRTITKTLLVVKLTFFLITMALLSAQANTMAQRVTISGNSLTFKKIFTVIEQQTGYVVFGNKELFASKKTHSLQVREIPLPDLMAIVLKDQPFDYTIDGKTIFISRKAPFGPDIPFPVVPSDQPPLKIRVADADGRPLPGASVLNKSTGISGVTDNEGMLSLNVSTGDVIEITFIGYEKLSMTIKDVSSVLNISLKTKHNALEEVVINGGYYTTRAETKLGNIVSISGDDIKNQPVTSPLMGLQGRAAGVDVTPNSGVPGSAPTIIIRGRNSLNFNGSFPLYVIDGVPVDASPILSYSLSVAGHYDPLASLNPADIHSIDILKDADATAIYGSRGANGVILITTRKGVQGKTAADLSITRGGGRVQKKLDLLHTREYLEMRREAFRNNNEAMDEFTAPDLMLWDTTRYTDWQDVLMGNTSDITTVQAGISGGGANTSFRLSGGYHKETTIYPGDFFYNRATGSFSLNHFSANKKFRANATANYGVTKGYNFDFSIPASIALTLPPNAPALYKADGTLNWELNSSGGSSWINPLANFKRLNETKGRNLMVNTSFSYDLSRFLTAKLSAGYTDLNSSEILTVPLTASDPLVAIYYSPERHWTTTQRQSWIVEPQLLITKALGDLDIDAVIGSTFQEGSNEVKNIFTMGYPSDALLNSFYAAGLILFQKDDEARYRYNSIFTRIAYSFKKKYLLNLTARRDGSSRFGKNNRFGNFGSVGAGWIFSKEQLIAEKLPFVSFGKIRGSYGIAGNDQIGDYKYINTYSATLGKYQGAFGLVPTALFNPDYKWERSKKLETALELSLFKNRVMMEIAWFRNQSGNLLYNYQLPRATGFNDITKNLDALIENRGLEFTASFKMIDKQNFQWTVSGNYSRSRNELVKFEGLLSSSYANNWVIGEPLSVSRMYRYTGVDPETGLYTFLDADHNGIMNDLDQVEIRNVGRTYFGGIGNDISFKGFQLSLLFQFVTQNARMFTPGSTPGSLGNMPREWYYNRWVSSGDESAFQKVTTDLNAQAGYFRLHQSDRTVENASFLRLKTLSLSYSLNSGLIKRAGLTNCRIFMQGQNLFTISKYSGLDPETGSYNTPPLRMLTLGLELGL